MTEDVRRIIVCEGQSDVAFLRQFMRARNLPIIGIRPARASGGGGGISAFENELRSLKINSNFRFQKVQRLMLVVDSDEDKQANFQAVLTQLQAAFPGRPVPSAPYIVSGGYPTVEIVMLPFVGEQGNLETEIKESALAGCARTREATLNFVAMAPNPFPQRAGRLDKLVLQSAISARARNPSWTLKDTLQDQPQIFNFDHQSLNQLAETLTRFCDGL